ncbi:MAG TPA: S-layer homology domain-containing protein [Coleofasciculaceae cyanobacterium]
MRKAKCTGRFYQINTTIRLWAYIIAIGSISSSTMLSTAAGIANATPPSPSKTTANANNGGSLGKSLLKNLLGAEALRPQPPAQPGTPPANSQQSIPQGQPSLKTPPVQIAQGATFPDIQGNWARSFIEALAERDIIVGFPDGTFRPNEPVTRAQFAAMIRKAFETAAERPGKDFVDVPANYWGYEAIQEAYRMGFLEGYPNDVFIPEQNIPRVQVLVSLVTGLDIPTPDQAETILAKTYQDAAQIPAFARPKVAAATLNQLVVNYPNLAFLNPNQNATRADVAAFIYQALVEAGRLPPLNPTDIAANYIVGYEPPIAKPPTPDDLATLRQQYRLPEAPVETAVLDQVRRFFGGGASIATPTAYGAQTGNVFLGFSYQERTRFTDIDDGAVVAGFGIGDARKLAALEVAATSYSTIRQGFGDNGAVSFKLHRTFPDNLAVAFGVENAFDWGEIDAGRSFYGVVSKVFPLTEKPSAPLSSLTVSAGVGSGRFRSEEDVQQDDGGANVFGSAALRVAEPVNVIVEWTGQDLNVGASISPIPGVPLIITPAAADITGNAGDGVRFILGVGYGIRF